MEDWKFRLGIFLSIIAVLCLILPFILPFFFGGYSVVFEFFPLISMGLFLLSALFLFLGRNQK